MKLIVLLRGINVGTGRKLLMTDVRAQCEAAGARDVVTYIQSGNIVCEHGKPAAFVPELAKRLTKVAGFDVPVIVRTAKEWTALIAANPYAREPVEHLHVFCMPEPAPADALAKVELAKFAPERCELAGRELYFYLPNGMGRSKLVVAMSRVKPLAGATARNWRTVLKLQELAA